MQTVRNMRPVTLLSFEINTLISKGNPDYGVSCHTDKSECISAVERFIEALRSKGRVVREVRLLRATNPIYYPRYSVGSIVKIGAGAYRMELSGGRVWEVEALFFTYPYPGIVVIKRANPSTTQIMYYLLDVLEFIKLALTDECKLIERFGTPEYRESYGCEK